MVIALYSLCDISHSIHISYKRLASCICTYSSEKIKQIWKRHKQLQFFFWCKPITYEFLNKWV